jgi:hypothetical protein
VAGSSYVRKRNLCVTEQIKRRVQHERFLIETASLARIMCDEMGLDPDEIVTVPRYMLAIPPMVYPDFGENMDARVLDTSIAAKRWEVMRPHAATALAGFRAVNRFFLTEK